MHNPWDVIYPTGDATAETVSATLDTTAKTYTVAFPVSTYAAAFATSENSKWCLTVHMGMTKATTSITFKNTVYPWWWWIVGSIDVVCFSSLITFGTLLTLNLVKSHRAKKKEDVA